MFAAASGLVFNSVCRAAAAFDTDGNLERRGAEANALAMRSAVDCSSSQGKCPAFGHSKSVGDSFVSVVIDDSCIFPVATLLDDLDSGFRGAFIAVLRVVDTGDCDGDDCLEEFLLRGDDSLLSLATGMYDIKGNLSVDLGIRDAFRFAGLWTSSVDKDR